MEQSECEGDEDEGDTESEHQSQSPRLTGQAREQTPFSGKSGGRDAPGLEIAMNPGCDEQRHQQRQEDQVNAVLMTMLWPSRVAQTPSYGYRAMPARG